MNAIDLLKSQHDRMRDVIAQLETKGQTETNNRDEVDKLFQDFKKLFNLHDRIEDDVLYRKLKDYPELRALALKGEQAHHVVSVGLLELRLMPYFSESWLPKFLVVKDSLLTHMHEEEEILFPKTNELVSESDQEELRDKIQKIIDRES